MRILFVGEYSRLHNSLKEGLITLGHTVTIIANGDGFKNYPVDLSTKARWSESKLGNIPRQIIFRLTNFDISKIEHGIRFYLHLNECKNFDVVQLINESPIQTLPFMERFLLKKIFKRNKKTYLLCCGVDYTIAKYMIQKTPRYSIMNPYFENPKLIPEYRYILDYLKPSKQKTHQLVYNNIKGVIASDLDYYLPLLNHPKFLGLVPNPISIKDKNHLKTENNSPIIIFLGINRGTYNKKGIQYFEKALNIIEHQFPSKVKIITVEDIPYQEYITLYDQAHILLDQVYAYDQGYNALEAMAKGKVVFTGAESEFMERYNLTERVAINALPDTNYLVNKLSFLIENPEEITAIGKRARAFIEKEHDYIKIAERYLEVWKN
ncbi:glycosyltransferase family 4 protein [Flavobacterium sp. ZT3R18]|uniref:glycosyltransferase family protein n=1 Tax=Flavobacterium sp. ZT3R18 TaxID=2594429 RepID=UPI001179FE21|nr:glycosyltransferase [Flavobacterium sp. ZT3R18]TRX32432.1 glycosyltransferase family 4 protein [Flavobacterium sp. ZT3R18]